MLVSWNPSWLSYFRLLAALDTQLDFLCTLWVILQIMWLKEAIFCNNITSVYHACQFKLNNNVSMKYFSCCTVPCRYMLCYWPIPLQESYVISKKVTLPQKIFSERPRLCVSYNARTHARTHTHTHTEVSSISFHSHSPSFTLIEIIVLKLPCLKMKKFS
jgi:hypothetical protein